ncbi:MAG: hypothetical protein ACJ75B_03075 [Flavisolibacter sp.]
MNELPSDRNKQKQFSVFEILFIIALACVPLFSSFPYRVNIFLSWEGAYRISQGEIPYRDFGMPIGYMYWTIPALFFKIFGAKMITLVKAQVFINIISGLAFRSILKSLDVQPGVRLLSVVLYCVSYSFFNFWPWYNHTVIVYEFVGLAFLLQYITGKKTHWIWLSLSALFIFFSFFTKQDGGGMALLLCLALLLYSCFTSRKWMALAIFSASFLIAAFAIIAPLTRFNFGYWFNHGQPPHTARLSFFDILDEFFAASQWIKFYFFLSVLLMVAFFKRGTGLSRQKNIFFLLTLGILVEAAVLQVTSYTPPDNNIFFHSFAFAFILSLLAELIRLDFFRVRVLMVGLLGTLLWWSGVFWKYFQRVFQKFQPPVETVSRNGENVVNRKTYMINRDTAEIPMSQWKYSGLKSFDKIYLPGPTVDGIYRLLQMDIVKKPGLRVLNMSELTPLAVEIPYQEEKGPDIPLWYHLGVAMFNKEAKMYEDSIRAKHYDLVLFEYIPTLNNFYPFRIRDSLQVYYQKADSFFAPRRGDTKGMIEVFVRK